MEYDFLRDNDPRKAGDELVRSGKADNALEEYERGRGLDPTDPELLLRIASALDVLGRSEEALETLQNGCALHPLNAHFKRFAAALLGKLGRFNEADEMGCDAEGCALFQDEPLLLARFIWSVVHGIAMLVIDG